jgi:transcriptional regulator with XRE-family HTH domain
MGRLGDKFAESLIKFRSEKGMTQAELATRIGLSRVTVNRWETHGAGAVMLDELEAISRTMEKPVVEVLGLEFEAFGTRIPASLLALLDRANPGQLAVIRGMLEQMVLEQVNHAAQDEAGKSARKKR